MKRFFVQWETYCDTQNEQGGFFVNANSIDEAYKLAFGKLPRHACIERIDEVKEND